ncbi:MAG TPA: ACT domain-containing protein [Elusimicrobiota bacterium]|jgi:hypothetical protein|nr:ACT domain-containing protein [Elusimicrobiota bacterium]
MKVSVVRQYSVFMPNRLGALTELSRHFAERGVNVIGIASEVRDDSGLVRIALDGDEDHSGILSKAGYASVETSLLSVELGDEPGQLHRLTRLLSDNGINITTVYATALGRGNSRVLLAVENARRAARVLELAAEAVA